MAIKVAFFDCDGTLTKVKSSWEYLHRRLNIWDDHADRYQALFRAGKIDYYEFCRRDALLWRGLPVSRVVGMLQDIAYQDGSAEIVGALKKRGVFTVILSTGLSLLIEKVRDDLGIDMALSNELLSEGGHLTGEIRINVDYDKKGHIVDRVLKELGATREEACALGDGEGDAGMFEAVGLAIGYHPPGAISRFVDRAIYGETLLDMISIVEDYEG
jgi:phosphoserine phosphatase